MALVWPPILFPGALSWWLENVSRGGGISTNGMEQFVGSGAGRWRADFEGVPAQTEEEVMAIRAFVARMRGRAGTVLLPVIDWRRSPWPRDAYGRQLSPRDVRRGRLDGTQFADPGVPAAAAIIATVSAPAARRASTISIGMSQGQQPKAGHYFSLGNRLHIITEALGGGTFQIEPPLRAAAPQGAAANFSNPVCEMRFVDDDQGKLMLDRGVGGFVSPSFVEAV